MSRSRNVLMFIWGLFSLTQVRVIGSIGITEFVAFILCPYFLCKDMPLLRRNGFSFVLLLSLLNIFGGIVSSCSNHTLYLFALRGFASNYAIFALLVFFHHYLQNSLPSFKWFLVGMAFSSIITVFVFTSAVEEGLSSLNTTATSELEAIVGGPLFWMQRIGPFLGLPIKGWYLQTPTWYCFLVPLIMPIFTIINSNSGRSSFAICLIGSLLLLYIRKRPKNVQKIQRHLMFGAFCVLVGALILKSGYQFAAESGYLNESATLKYKDQTRGGDSALRILMSGRVAFFSSAYACLKKPIIGYGPWAIDEDDTYKDFLAKYGAVQDYEDYTKFERDNPGSLHFISTHSHLTGAWLSNGIFGLIFWLYALYVMYTVLRKYVVSVPFLYGFIMLEISSFTWNIFFSPFNGRTFDMFFLTILLLVRSVSKKVNSQII